MRASAPNYQALGLVTGAQPCDPGTPINGGFPNTTISGFTALGFGGFTSVRTNQFYTFMDNVSYTRGNHLFKLGGLFRPIMFNGDALRNNRGALTFGTVAAFTGATALEDVLAGVPSTGTILEGDLLRHVKQQSYGIYAQDDWRITRRVTLNFGLRYEYTSPIRDQVSMLGNFSLTTSDPVRTYPANEQPIRIHAPKQQFPTAFWLCLGCLWQWQDHRARRDRRTSHHHARPAAADGGIGRRRCN